MNPYNIPWPGCHCPDCLKYNSDENFRNEIQAENRRAFLEGMREVLERMAQKFNKE